MSVRLRLTLWSLGSTAAILAVFSLGVHWFMRDRLLGQLTQRIERQLAAVEKTLREEPEDLYELEEHGSVVCFRVWTVEGLVYESAGWRHAHFTSVSLPVPEPDGSASRWLAVGNPAYRARARVVDAGGPRCWIAVAEDQRAVFESLRTLTLVLLAALPTALVLAFVAANLLARKLLEPVGEMATEAREISAERLAARLPVRNADDEFGRLALVFNDLLIRLEDSFERLRRFTADASHELRTPLTAIRSVGEVGLRDGADPEAHREVIGSMLEETQRLTRLVDSLLVLTRADSSSIELQKEPVELGELIERVAEMFTVLAEEKGQELAVTVRAAVVVRADRTTLRRAVVNVLGNAVEYGERAISMTVDKRGSSTAVIEIADDGPGIRAEERSKVFDRFYRGNAGHSIATAGAGLGLAIARWAVEVNGGSIEIESEPGAGSLFRILLPIDREERKT